MDLSQWIERHACFTPQATAIRFKGDEITYADLLRRIDRAASVLGALGAGTGDVIAFLGLNSPRMLEVLFACARIGAIVCPVNWRLAAPELARVLADCTPRALLVEPGFVEPVCGIQQGLDAKRLVALGAAPPGWADWDELEQATPPPEGGPRAGGEHAPLLICYTSGSTGAPKGVVFAQSALQWNAVNSAHMHDLTSADRVLTTLPMFHVGGLNIQTLPALHVGACVSLHAKFDPLAALEAIASERITLAVLVPTQLTAMMEMPQWLDADLSSLRMITTGSTIISERFARKVNGRGIPMAQVYGATETCPIAAYQRAADALRKPGSAGAPALHCELKIVDDEGRALPPGADGEILVRGNNLMIGYWKSPGQTASALRDGWYWTGDFGHFDAEGHLYVVSRRKDMIITGGENVYPEELESILLDCPGIAEACVVGRQDDRWGETVVAAVVAKPGVRLDQTDVMSLFDGRIARYKQPRDVCFLATLQRTAMGKVRREAVRAALARPRL